MPVYINDAKAFVESYCPVAEAVQKSKVKDGLARAVGMESVAISSTLAPADLARHALSLITSDYRSFSNALAIHATVRGQGHDFWPSWAYICKDIKLSNLTPVGIAQMSSGGVIGISMAAGCVLSGLYDAGFVVTSDCFDGPYFDRWNSDYGTFYGDAGTALLLSTEPGPFKILSTSSTSDSRLEGLYRGLDDIYQFEMSRVMVDVAQTSKEFFSKMSYHEIIDGMKYAIKGAVSRCLADAEISSVQDIDLFVVPHLGRLRTTSIICDALRIDLDRTTWGMGTKVGHLGGGDHIWAISEMLKDGSLTEGTRQLFIGIGAGFSVSCILTEKISF